MHDYTARRFSRTIFAEALSPIQITEVKVNVPVEDARFAKPAGEVK
jgi:hypothetical protein